MNEYIAIILGIIAIAIIAIYFIWTKLLDSKEKEETEETETTEEIEKIKTPQKVKIKQTTINISVWKIALGTFIGIIGAHFTIEIIEAIKKYLLLISFFQ